MRETLISAGGRAPHAAVYDTSDVVARYRRRQAQRRALLGPTPPRPGRQVHPAAPVAPVQDQGRAW